MTSAFPSAGSPRDLPVPAPSTDPQLDPGSPSRPQELDPHTVARIVEGYTVWTLRGEGGVYLPLPPRQGADALSRARHVFGFWSTREAARRVAGIHPDFQDFAPQEIPWVAWADSWAPGLSAQEMLVCLDWSGLGTYTAIAPGVVTAQVAAAEPEWMRDTPPHPLQQKEPDRAGGRAKRYRWRR